MRFCVLLLGEKVLTLRISSHLRCLRVLRYEMNFCSPLLCMHVVVFLRIPKVTWLDPDPRHATRRNMNMKDEPTRPAVNKSRALKHIPWDGRNAHCSNGIPL